jgi:hypothetical protein
MLMPAKVVAKVNIAESIDIAKAAVGFFSTFTANVHPYNYAPYRNYQSTVTLTDEEREPSMLCHNIGQAKHVFSHQPLTRLPLASLGVSPIPTTNVT